MIRAAAALAIGAAALTASAPSAAAPRDVPNAGIVTNNGNAGTGSLRAVLATCPDTIGFAFTDYEIHIAETLVVDCPNPVAITGPVSTVQPIVPGSEGRTVGTASLPLPAIPQPGVTIVNHGGGDGLLIRSDNVTVTGLGSRGTTAQGAGDIAVRDASGVTLTNVTMGLDANGLTVPPSTYRTGTSLLMAVDSSGVRLNGVAAGWNVNFWGAVVFQNVHGGHVYRSMISGASFGKPPVDTKDALSLVYGTSDFIVRETVITDNTSSSAVELHTADRVTIDTSTFQRIGRAGVTVFDARDVMIADVRISEVGTCGGGDDGGIVVYGGSQRVTSVGAYITTNYCQGAYRPVFKVLPGASAELR